MSLVQETSASETTTTTTPTITPDPTAVATAAMDNIQASVKDWFYDENIKGSGNKPDWMIDKFKTATDQAKAYGEIEKRLGAFKGAPDSYDLTLKDHPDIKFLNDDPMLKDFLESAKKNNVSQEYISEILDTYAKALTHNVPDVEAEMAKLGANAQQDVNLLTQWANSNFNSQEFNVFKSLLTTAESVRFFEKIRNMSTSSEVAPPSTTSSVRETEDQVRALISDPRYETSEPFRQEVRARMAAAMGRK